MSGMSGDSDIHLILVQKYPSMSVEAFGLHTGRCITRSGEGKQDPSGGAGEQIFINIVPPY